MNNSFKQFYKSSSQPAPAPVKWSVLLFTGDYDPICKEEYHRIGDFIKNYVRSNPGKFEENADIGLLTSSGSLDSINTQMKFELTFEERQYLTGKLFGFKMFPIDFNELFSLAHFDKDAVLKNKINGVSKFFKEQFDNANILVVLRPNESNMAEEVKEVSHVFSDNGINIGFISYEHTPTVKDEYFKKIPVTGKMIKACCLMDSERPDALSLKNFAYKFNLQDVLDQIKLMHFRAKNEKYDLIFKHLFPDIKLHERTNEEQEYNVRTMMEIVKRMYISKV
jgi:hypothetical protein